MADLRLCSIPDCGKPVKARGMCYMHDYRSRMHGDPLGGRTPNGESTKFLEFLRGYEGDDCIMWPYNTTESGYGYIRYKGENRIVTRILCEDMYGPPAGDRNEAAHSCNNGHLGCATKRHLSWKTRKENAEDMKLAGTSPHGERNGHAKLTDADVTRILSLIALKKLTQREISKVFSVSEQTICDIKKGRAWTHVPLIEAHSSFTHRS